jgi:hypothetical protein
MKLRADEVKEGMYLDLEGDKYATMPSPDASEDDLHDFELTVSTFEFEYGIVHAIIRESPEVIVIHTETISFACPPDHELEVTTHVFDDEGGVAQHQDRELAPEEFLAEFSQHHNSQ